MLLPIDYQYRILQVQSREQAARLILTQTSSAAEWWIVGQVALDHGNNGDALDSFNRAIELDRLNGDYYVSRAQAQLASNPQETARDLDTAVLLKPLFSSPDAVRSELAATPEEKI